MQLNDKLQNIVNHAINTTPFYREQAKSLGLYGLSKWTTEDFCKLPLITKQCIQENYDSFISEPYKTFPGNRYVGTTRTSGSTGKYLKVLWDASDYNRSMMGLWLIRKAHHNILPTDKYCYFYATEYMGNNLMEPREQSQATNERSIGFCKNNFTSERLKKVYMSMYEFDPKWVMIQPSIALLLAEHIMTEKLPPLRSLKYLEISSELLTEQARETISSVFPGEIANIYGCIEVNWIAVDRAKVRLYCLSSNVYTEIIKDGIPISNGQEGDIYVTSLCNHAMPFIRYQTGDRGILRKDESSGYNYLELSSGRISQYVITKDYRLPSYVFLRPIELINEKFGNIIRQFRVTQNDIDDFSIELSITSSYLDYENTIPDLFVKSLYEPALSNAKWTFTYHNMIFPDKNTGKVSLFVQNTPMQKKKSGEASSPLFDTSSQILP